MRDYGIEPQVWGGDPACQHEWGGERKRKPGEHAGDSSQLLGGRRRVIEAQDAAKQATSGAFCRLCGAWRGSLGLEPTPQLFVEHMVSVFEEVRRVLRPDGTLWLNLGDTYASDAGAMVRGKHCGKNSAAGEIRQPNRGVTKGCGLKTKDLCGIPWRVALALQDAGWWLRSEVIWAKSNAMPESVTDRPSRAHESVFLLSKRATYFYDADAVREKAGDQPSGNGFAGRQGGARTSAISGGDGSEELRTREKLAAGRNLRSVWTIATQPFPEAHFATFPTELAERCIRAGTSAHGVCGACGAPWKRLTEREFIAQEDVSPEKGVRAAGDQKPMDPSNGWSGVPRGATRTTTTGWGPTCGCDAEIVPCTVLDPFAGAGTTLMVAAGLGRRAIGIELKPEYAEMAARRIRGAAPLLNRVEIR